MKENAELRKSAYLEEDAHKNSPEKFTALLSEKVRQQAIKLQILENYKSLCEKRILELFPSHPIPVTEKDLGNIPEKFKGQECMELQKIIEMKNQDLHFSKKKIEKLIIENEHLKIGFKGDKQPANINQLIEKIKTLNEDKYQLEESLRAESLVIEEQRNYIEILKQTIESKLEEINIPQINEIYKQPLLNQNVQQKEGYLNSERASNNISDRIEVSSDPKNYKSLSDRKCYAELEDARNTIKKLEEEKNSLLDYIEGNIEKANHISKIEKENNELVSKLLEKEKLLSEISPNKSNFDNIIISLKEQMSEMSAQNEIEKSALNKEIEEKIKIIQMIENLNENLNSNLKLSEKELEKIKEDYEKIIKDLKMNFDSERNNLNIKIKELSESTKQESEIMKNQAFKNTKMANKSLSCSMTEIQNDLKIITQNRDQLQKDKQSIENGYNELIEKFKKLKNEKENLEKANLLLFEQNENLKNYKTSKKFKNEKQFSQLKNESKKMEIEMKKLRDDYDLKASEKNEELKKLYSEISESRNENQIMQNEIIKYKELQINDSSEIISLKKQIGAKENNLLENMNLVMEKEKEIKELLNICEEMKFKLKNQEGTIQELNIGKMKGSESQLMVDHITQELNDFKEKYAKMEDALARSEKEVSSLEFENKEFKNKYNILKSDYVNLKSIEEEKDELVTKINQEKDEACMNLSKLEERYQLIKSSLEEKSHELENAKNQLAFSNTEIQEVLKENDEIKHELMRNLNLPLDFILEEQSSITSHEKNKIRLGKNLKDFIYNIRNISNNSKSVIELISDIHDLIKLLIEEIN